MRLISVPAVNYNGVADAKTSHFDGSTADLNAVVAHLLLRTPISNPELVRGLGLVASVQAKRHVEVCGGRAMRLVC